MLNLNAVHTYETYLLQPQEHDETNGVLMALRGERNEARRALREATQDIKVCESE